MATAYWAAPPPKSPKATNPDTTGPTGAAAVADVDVDVDTVVEIVDGPGAAGFVFAVEAPPPQAAKTTATTVTVMDRRRIHSTLPENDPKELSRLPLVASRVIPVGARPEGVRHGREETGRRDLPDARARRPGGGRRLLARGVRPRPALRHPAPPGRTIGRSQRGDVRRPRLSFRH